MFGHGFVICVCVLLLYYLFGCILKIIGISLDSDTVSMCGSAIFYFPVALVTLLVSLIFTLFAIPIAALSGIKNIISTKFLYNGGVKEARKLMEEIEAEENDQDDEDNSI